MKRRFPFGTAAFAALVLLAGPATNARQSADLRALEEKFDANLSADSLRSWMEFMTARPHHTGSPYGARLAEWMAENFRSWGYETVIDSYDVLFPTPKERLLEMTAPEQFTASLKEPEIPGDRTSGQADEQLPTYNIYSADGDVTGELVYVNYGVPDDYKVLEERGVDVRGKIVIARYGGSWRGIKPKVAAEKGAVGCIIFSDPSGDGRTEGDVYPKGGYRNDQSAQRGSVADMPIHAGDPLTPFQGATKDAKRLPFNEVQTLTRIPVLPIAAADALPLLQQLGGPVAPESWRGALPITYHLGPGPATVHLKLEFNWKTVTARNVIATIRGSELSDQWIIRGNHHDAWVNGATDPISGMVAELAEARSIGALVKAGWKPKRSIIFCAWDAEEPGLLGSTEWVEEHADALKTRAAVYINTDSNGRGFLHMGGSHTLEKFVNTVARDVSDPQMKISVLDRARAAEIVGGDDASREKARAGGDLAISPLGSGSDYTPFLQHLGVASLNLGFGGEDHYGSYHSIYDSYDHFTRFVDPDFAYGVTLAKISGRMVIRLADANVLPFEFTNFADKVGEYVKEVAELADRMRSETEEHNKRVAEGSIVRTRDPRETFTAPAPKDRVPYFNFAPLQNAVGRVRESAARYGAAVQKAVESGDQIAMTTTRKLDKQLMGMERRLTLPEGLPGRPWYTHQIYAPGAYTGYGVKTLPAVRESIELRRWHEVDGHIATVARVLDEYAAAVDEAVSVLESR